MAIKVEMMTRIATTLIPKKVLLLMMMMMLMRQDHPVMGVMMMRDSWHLKLFFSLDQDVGFGGQSVSVGDFFGNDKIKFLSFKKLNS